jgi:hypothetical protein
VTVVFHTAHTINNRSHLLPVLCIPFTLQQTTHIRHRKSIIALCDLFPKIHVPGIYVFPIIRTYLLMLEHSDKNVIGLEMTDASPFKKTTAL